MEAVSGPAKLEAVDSLLVTAVRYCVRNVETLLADRDDQGYYHLKPNLTLPVNICELVLKAFYDEEYEINDGLLNIFCDTSRTRLCRARLRDSLITDEGVEVIAKHNLVELDLSNCMMLTPRICQSIDEHCPNLRALHFNTWEKFVHVPGKKPVFNCQKLKVLVARNLMSTDCINLVLECFVMRLLESFTDLHLLDVSCSAVQVAELSCLRTFKNLSSLIMFDCDLGDINKTVDSLTNIKTLRHLDISQDVDEESGHPVTYSQPEHILRTLVQGLPVLVSLDISGTNLAGLEPARRRSHRLGPATTQQQEEVPCPIQGLEGRQFEFLGLFQCSYGAGSRRNIPAKLVAGDGDEHQMVVSLEKYSDRPKYVEKILDDMFHTLRASGTPALLARQFRAIVNVMEKHLKDYHIQISASASLFYVTKSLDQKVFTTMKDRRRAITCLLNAMERYPSQDAMTRNCCLTLCNFDIPNDVRFSYTRVIKLLLSLIQPPNQEEFVRRIGIYLLNSLACQVDGSEKQLIGNLGAVALMLDVIADKLASTVCDEVLEVSWSTMWNITDETPLNCQRFLDGRGMHLFTACLQAFPGRNDLLRNMMGLMGNIAEVKFLRPQLMCEQFVSVFADLVESTSDGIEVSYNACGVLSHMLSDGPDAWTVQQPDRDDVCGRVEAAVSRWAIDTDRNINYRSFEPILRLLSADTPCVQYWATWALCNLTKVYPHKYCSLLHREGGVELLARLLANSGTKEVIKDLARDTIELTTSSFEPILRLLSADTPCVQYWATWALCNLTKVYPHKYCSLLHREGGVELLARLLANSGTKEVIKDLARDTIELTTSYRAAGSVSTSA